MDFAKYFSFWGPVIPADKVMELSENDLSDLYVSSDEVDRLNVYFHLENEYFYLMNENRTVEAAHICYLISYYLFMVLTPPRSESLAMEYTKKALSLNNILEYQEWLEVVKRGN